MNNNVKMSEAKKTFPQDETKDDIDSFIRRLEAVHNKLTYGLEDHYRAVLNAQIYNPNYRNMEYNMRNRQLGTLIQNGQPVRDTTYIDIGESLIRGLQSVLLTFNHDPNRNNNAIDNRTIIGKRPYAKCNTFVENPFGTSCIIVTQEPLQGGDAGSCNSGNNNSCGKEDNHNTNNGNPDPESDSDTVNDTITQTVVDNGSNCNALNQTRSQIELTAPSPITVQDHHSSSDLDMKEYLVSEKIGRGHKYIASLLPSPHVQKALEALSNQAQEKFSTRLPNGMCILYKDEPNYYMEHAPENHSANVPFPDYETWNYVNKASRTTRSTFPSPTDSSISQTTVIDTRACPSRHEFGHPLPSEYSTKEEDRLVYLPGIDGDRSAATSPRSSLQQCESRTDFTDDSMMHRYTQHDRAESLNVPPTGMNDMQRGLVSEVDSSPVTHPRVSMSEQMYPHMIDYQSGARSRRSQHSQVNLPRDISPHGNAPKFHPYPNEPRMSGSESDRGPALKQRDFCTTANNDRQIAAGLSNDLLDDLSRNRIFNYNRSRVPSPSQLSGNTNMSQGSRRPPPVGYGAPLNIPTTRRTASPLNMNKNAQQLLSLQRIASGLGVDVEEIMDAVTDLDRGDMATVAAATDVDTLLETLSHMVRTSCVTELPEKQTSRHSPTDATYFLQRQEATRKLQKLTKIIDCLSVPSKSLSNADVDYVAADESDQVAERTAPHVTLSKNSANSVTPAKPLSHASGSSGIVRSAAFFAGWLIVGLILGVVFSSSLSPLVQGIRAIVLSVLQCICTNLQVHSPNAVI